MTTLEIDPALAHKLAGRLRNMNVRVAVGDGAEMPFDDATFSAAVCFTMLHHVPSTGAQDRLLKEVRRVLRPGGMFAGTDSRWSRGLQWMHYRDTFVPVDPGPFAERLARAGFSGVKIALQSRVFRFHAVRA